MKVPHNLEATADNLIQGLDKQKPLEKDILVLLLHRLELGHAIAIVKHRNSLKDLPNRDLKTMLDNARIGKVSNPRDKVYAFISLAYPRYNTIPDYDSMLETVYMYTC